jgi:choline dehydrogenase
MPDYIVVGGGSAGAVVASRLTEDPSIEVLLLESGVARPPRESTIPAAFSRLFGTVHDWGYTTEPEPALSDRRLYWPRGRLLGGSSAMNAMIWTPGARADFDEWKARGNRGWGYDDVRPLFDRIERTARSPRSGVGIQVSRHRTVNPLSGRFLEAASDLGIPPNDGFRDGNTDGAGLFRVSQDRGVRSSTARGYLDPVASRSNLRIEALATVSRIELAGGRAIGVRYRRDGVELHARGAVILAAGAIGSPALLLRSGIGPAGHLESLGIPVALDLPGVGANLQDHLAIGIMHHLGAPLSLASASRLDHLLRYLVLRRGPLTSNVAEAGAFVRRRSGVVPDLELLFAPTWFVDHGRSNPAGHGFTIAAIALHPTSRGTIRLRAADPEVPPLICPRYLADSDELELLVEGVELARALARHRAFEPYRGPEFLPGPGADLRRFVRDRAETLYHPVGTCRMGADRDAVVSDRLGVHGVADLWVADASVMPGLPTGHPNAATVMIGERAAELVRSA